MALSSGLEARLRFLRAVSAKEKSNRGYRPVQIVALYKREELVGKHILGVVNFPPRKIGPFESEVLTLGIPDSEGKVILITPDKAGSVVGGKLF